MRLKLEIYKVGGYPIKKGNHRMPTCCYVMKHIMKPGDIIVHEPPRGKSAYLTIGYKLPRVIDLYDEERRSNGYIGKGYREKWL